MRKVFFCVAACILSVTMLHAQNFEDKWDLKASVILYGGYNILEKAPAAGAAVGLDVNFIRAELDIGWSYLDAYSVPVRKHLAYFSPSVGFAYGKKVQGYIMAGCTTWGVVESAGVTHCAENKFSSDLFHWKVKAGANVMVSRKFFINADLGYMFPKDAKDGYLYYENLTLRIGAGCRF